MTFAINDYFTFCSMWSDTSKNYFFTVKKNKTNKNVYTKRMHDILDIWAVGLPFSMIVCWLVISDDKVEKMKGRCSISMCEPHSKRPMLAYDRGLGN